MKKLFRLCRYDWPLHFVLLLTNWLPDNVACLRLRGGLARRFLGACGTNLWLGRNITFYNPSGTVFGSNIYVAYGCWFMAGERITVEDEVIFGPYCVIVSSNHTRSAFSFRFGKPQQLPIRVGRGTWVAAHVTLTAGSSVGSGSLIGANSVVRGEIPDNVLAAGVPARVMKKYGD